MSDDRGGTPATWVVTGPTCDSQDTLHHGALLSADLQIGDRVELGTAGAYITAYASTFNGFPVPTIRYLDDSAVCETADMQGEPLRVGLS